jgi:hypothetical protein
MLDAAGVELGFGEQDGSGVLRAAGDILVPRRVVGDLPIEPVEPLAARVVAQRAA